MDKLFNKHLTELCIEHYMLYLMLISYKNQCIIQQINSMIGIKIIQLNNMLIMLFHMLKLIMITKIDMIMKEKHQKHNQAIKMFIIVLKIIH